MQVNLDKPLLDNSNMTDFCQKIKYFADDFGRNSRKVGRFAEHASPARMCFVPHSFTKGMVINSGDGMVTHTVNATCRLVPQITIDGT